MERPAGPRHAGSATCHRPSGRGGRPLRWLAITSRTAYRSQEAWRAGERLVPRGQPLRERLRRPARPAPTPPRGARRQRTSATEHATIGPLELAVPFAFVTSQVEAERRRRGRRHHGLQTTLALSEDGRPEVVAPGKVDPVILEESQARGGRFFALDRGSGCSGGRTATAAREEVLL